MAMNGNVKAAAEKQKLIQEKCLAILSNMLKDEDNKYCVDCDAKGPRWASWNLGVFLCIRCAGIHRNLGVHISKVKSVNLDTWKPEQAVALQQMGNSRARAVYEANLPDNFRRPQTDSSLESFIRAKYEHNKYTAREWVPPRLPKVNWDAEIEATLKEQRSARKSGRAKVEVPAPALSKPQAAVPKPLPPAAPTQSRSKAKPTEPPPASAAADLLGLETPAPATAAAGGADPFGDFLTAAPDTNPATASAVTGPAAAAASPCSGDAQLASEEASFFSQPAASAAATSVLSRDSILALYGQAGGGPQGPAGSGGGGGGLAGYPGVPTSSVPAGFPGLPATSAVAGYSAGPATSAVAGYSAGPAAGTAGGFPGVPAGSGVGAFPATSTVAGFPSMPTVSGVGGFPPQQQQPASYPAGQGFSMGYPAAQQQQQFAGLQQQQFQQQAGAFQEASHFQQQPQQAAYMAGAAFSSAQPVGAAAGPQLPPQLHQQMAGLSMGHPPLAAAGGFPPLGAAAPAAMGSSVGGQLWQ